MYIHDLEMQQLACLVSKTRRGAAAGKAGALPDKDGFHSTRGWSRRGVTSAGCSHEVSFHARWGGRGGAGGLHGSSTGSAGGAAEHGRAWEPCLRSPATLASSQAIRAQLCQGDVATDSLGSSGPHVCLV